jgi:hypothetical protein
MNSTKVFTISRSFNLATLPKVGEAIEINTAYPMMHDDYGNAHFFVLHSVHVDDGILQVIGDGDNGWYEWVWFRLTEHGRGEIHHTRSGFGMASFCLHNGLTFAFNEQSRFGYETPTHTKEGVK